MSAVDDILASLPVDRLAEQLGVPADQVRATAEATIPALLGGLDANAQDAAGASSIADALGQHADDLGLGSGQVDLDRVDETDGARIASHIFGDREGEVAAQLGGLGGGSLAERLIPILAPIVLAYLAKQIGGRAGSGSGDAVGSILQEILTGMAQGSTPAGGKSAGSIITDVLGGLLGGGRR